MKTGNSVGALSATSAQVQLLRSRVEVDVKQPGIVMVTSAHQGDGKNLTARALAAGLKMQGYRTALVGLSPGPVERSQDWAPFGCHSDNAPVIEVLRGNEGDGITPEELVAFVNRMRSEYDYTVVVAGTFLSSPPTMALSRLVDGVLLAIRIGRAPSDEDHLTVQLIERSRGRIVGVVATDAESAGEIRHRKPKERAVKPMTEAAASANATPSVKLANLSRFFRPNY